MIDLLITVIVVGLVLYLVYWLLLQIPLPPPFRVVANVVLALIAIIFLLGLLTGNGWGIHPLHLSH